MKQTALQRVHFEFSYIFDTDCNIYTLYSILYIYIDLIDFFANENTKHLAYFLHALQERKQCNNGNRQTQGDIEFTQRE